MASTATMARVDESPEPPESFEADDEPSIVPSGNVGFWVGDADGVDEVGVAVGAGVVGTPVGALVGDVVGDTVGDIVEVQDTTGS